MRPRHACCLLIALGAALLAPACHRATPAEAEGPQRKGTALPAPAPMRSTLYAPAVMVQGQGRHADSLLDRVRADLPAGWQGRFVVEDGCADDDCLHWWMASADGTQLVGELPKATIEVVVPEAGTYHMDPAIVKRYAESLRKRLYPTSRVVDATYYAFESRTSTDDITLVLDDVRDGRPYRVEIHTWMRVSDAEQSSVEEDRRTATLRTTLYSAPADAFDHEYLRREVAFVVHLEREGWDFELGACLKKAWWIHYAQYIGADEDARKAEDACHREWEVRKRLRDLVVTEIGAPFWHDGQPMPAPGADTSKTIRTAAD